MSNYLKHKPGSLEDVIKKNLPEDGYQDKFKKELDKAGKGIGAMTPKEKSAFFNKVDDIKKTKDEDAKKVQKQNVDSKRLKEENDTAFAISGVESERPVENPDLRSELQERGGANTSTRQGSFAKSRKPKYRFGYRVAEKDPSVKEKKENLENTIKGMWGEAAKDTEERGDSKLLPTKNKVETKKEDAIPAIKKDNKPGVKIAKIRAIRDKETGQDSAPGEPKKDPEAMEKQILTLQGQVNQLKVKLENEKNKAVKPTPDKETGEVPLTVGLAHKLLRDKAEKKEEEEKKDVKKEDVDKPGFKDYVMKYLKQEKEKSEKGKGKTMTGEPATKVDTKPEIKYTA